MNERLKEEIELWKHKRCSYDEHGDISATAQHFYNLALKDIREKCKDYKVGVESGKDDEGNAIYESVTVADILDFIDHTSK